jgi:ABC-type amino acid transport substrate-binding protein
MNASRKASRSLVLSLLGALGIVVAAQPASAQDKPKVLLVCAEPAAMPRTGKAPDGTPQGLDLALAQLLSKAMGRTLEVHWCASPACSRKCLREGRCDVILGHPHDPDGAKDIAWSVPYAGSQFGLVVSKDAKNVRSLADLRGKRVGIVAGTVVLSEKDHAVGHFKTREDLLNHFQAEKLDAAFLDADFASWYLHAHPKLNLQLVKDYVPREHWNMALAVRAKDAPLVVELNKALSELAESGQIRKVYTDLGVAYRDPFTNSARRTVSFNTWKRIQDRGLMAVSMDPANLPYSSAKGDRPGFDVELLQSLAKEMGVKLRIDWLDIHRTTAMGKLLERESDLVFGTAIDANAFEDDDDLASRVIFSQPYYSTGYLLVKRKNGPTIKSLADLKGEKSRRLGAEAGSVADYRLRQRGYLRSLYRNQLAVLKALHDGDIDYAYLWGNVGWSLHTSPDFTLELISGYTPEDRWNIAIAMRHGDEDLKRHVDAALAKLIKDGTVARTLARYHMPYSPPFKEEKKKDKDDKDKSDDGQASETGVIRHPVAGRGLEPQTQRLQTSKRPYGGLERIRSAGMLVVGLDQRNLPFSTAHPEPAGLDYEIAGLLAEKLGVTVRVYWAYSAHDSYPSKLATRKLCDVMLGVMPDARFAERVLYSKPYYLASYRLVVKEGDGLPIRPTNLEHIGNAPLAVERGVAVRGLPEKAVVREFASLDTILEAVAKDEVKAGYVISTRSQWLADRDWRGKLKFIDGPAVDRFPICAAVRKSDADLQKAIDRAFVELAQSGQLAKVFARWHIPYLSPSNEEKSSK